MILDILQQLNSTGRDSIQTNMNSTFTSNEQTEQYSSFTDILNNELNCDGDLDKIQEDLSKINKNENITNEEILLEIVENNNLECNTNIIDEKNDKENPLKEDEKNTKEMKNDEIGIKNLDSVKYSLSNQIESDILYNENTTNELFIKDNNFSIKETLTLSDNIKNKDENIIESSHSTIEEQSVENENYDGEFITLNREQVLNSEDMQGQSQIIESPDKEILKQIKQCLSSNSATRNIQVMLKPHTLGKVNINFKFFNNALHVNVYVENSITEDALRQNLSQISEIINPNGLVKIEEINIKKISDLSDNRRLDEELKIAKSKKQNMSKVIPIVKSKYKM